MFDLTNFYRSSFRGKIFVIKAGGKVITDPTARTNLIRNIQTMNDDGIKVLLIYGGGHAIDAALKAKKVKVTKVNGRRITTKDSINTIRHVLNGDLGGMLNCTLAQLDVSGLVLNALPHHWTKLKRRDPYEGEKRYDSDILSVEKNEIARVFKGTSLVIAPCLGIGDSGDVLNINADNVSIHIAIGLKASKLVFLTDIDGVQIDGQTQSVLTAHEIEDHIADGHITDGMQVKMENCIRAVRNGVRRVHILNGFHDNVLLDEIYTAQGDGTMIVQEKEKKRYEKEIHSEENET